MVVASVQRMTLQEIQSILNFGAGLTVDGNKWSADELKAMAAFAKSGGARLTIAGGRLPVAGMQAIAAHGKGFVVFAGTAF
jgi:hypothetical protein